MDTMNPILSRKSIRKFTSKTVSDPVIDDLLKAAMSAPSAGNEQPWHFIIIGDSQILEKIPEANQGARMAKDASAVIVVYADLLLGKMKGCWILDCSAATRNIFIAVQAKGLGEVWSTIYPLEERVSGIQRLLDIPNHVMPLVLIPTGYPAEKNPEQIDTMNPGFTVIGW